MAKQTAVKISEPMAKGRKPNGQFGKGHSESKGHRDPAGVMKREFTRWFKEAVTKEDIKAIAKNLISIAMSKEGKGSVQAAKEVFDRCMGKSPQSLNIGGPDGQPLAAPTLVIHAPGGKDGS